MLNPFRVLILFFCTAQLSFAASNTPSEQPANYRATKGIIGTLDSIGSDSLNNLMSIWAEAFREIYPNVTIQIEGKGSSTAPTALIEGTAQIGPMSRPMKASERNKFRARFGYEPHAVGVALDTLAIFVHKDNPLQSLSLRQLDGIFSQTGYSGSPAIELWKDLSLPQPWAFRQITLHGRNSASGTYGFFKSSVLRGGDFRLNVNEQPGSSAVIQSVASDLFGIGYSAIGYKTASVKVLSISKDGKEPVYPTFENCLSGSYPITRLLYIYVNKDSRKGIDTLTREFLKFVLSPHGQDLVHEAGYYPLPKHVAENNLTALLKE